MSRKKAATPPSSEATVRVQYRPGTYEAQTVTVNGITFPAQEWVEVPASWPLGLGFGAPFKVEGKVPNPNRVPPPLVALKETDEDPYPIGGTKHAPSRNR